MEEIIIKKYKTEDGHIFVDKWLAEAYEKELKNKNNIEIELPSGVKFKKEELVTYFKDLGCDQCPFSRECAKSIDYYKNGLCYVITGEILEK